MKQPEHSDKNSADALRRELLLRPLWWGLGIAAVLGIFKLLAEINKGVAWPEILSQMASFFPLLLLAPIFTTAVGIALRHLQLNARFDEHVASTRERLAAIDNDLKIVHLANDRIAKLEPHVRDEDDYAIMVRLAAEWRKINSLLEKLPDLQDLVKWKLTAILEDLWRNWEKLGKGMMLISDSDQEFELNALIFRFLKPKVVRAVSWSDEAYWMSPFGRAFLESQRDYLQQEPGREIRRVFFTIPNFEYREIFAQQIAAGVQVRQIPLSEIENSRTRAQDVVIYDDRCSKLSRVVGRGQGDGAELKEAELFFVKDQIERSTRSFDDIWRAATPVQGVS